MIRVIPRERFGRTEAGWLSARHHFSFGGYVDPARLQFGALRVWNDDRFRAGGGLPMHPHRDMEIITVVHDGALTHADSLGNRGVTAAGNIQVMSAGTGILHSEHNHEDGDLELFQIWLLPDAPGHRPRWQNGAFTRSGRRNRLNALAAGEGRASGALPIHQDATLYAADLEAGAAVEHTLAAGRRAYLVPVQAAVRVNGFAVPARGAAEITRSAALTIAAGERPTDVVLLDLP